jgi:hypothetical protein
MAGDERRRAAQEGTVSAGELDEPNGQSPAGAGGIEVIVGEIPAADEPTTMRWTARCSDPDHDLLGQFPNREEAERAKDDHQRHAHGGT